MVLDGLLEAPPLSRIEFEQSTGYLFGSRNLITYHSETLLEDRGIAGFEALLQALEATPCHVLFTHPNADSGGDRLPLLQAFIQRHPHRSWAVPSLANSAT